MFKKKMKFTVPPLSVIRISIKAATAVTLSLIFVFINKVRWTIGGASTLCTLGTLLYFPVQPVGANIKTMFLGVMSISIGAAWSLLTNVLANLARDPTIDTPMQSASSAISAIFCTILIFTIVYVRSNYPQVLFGTVFAGMIGSFAMTQNANAPGFQPKITWTFLAPLLYATGISLFINLFLWPEDDATAYFNILSKTIQDYHDLYQETIKTFLEYQAMNDDTDSPSLANLRTKLQKTFIKLIDQQHNVEFTVIYSRFSQGDMAKLTQKVKDMRTPLHGIGMSLLMKHKRSRNTELYETKEDKMYPNVPIYKEITPTTQSLTEACATSLQSCVERIERFKAPPRSLLSTVLWPFPRLFTRTRYAEPNQLHQDILTQRLATYEAAVRDWRIKHVEINHQPVTRQVAYLFQFNMVQFASSVHAFTDVLEEMDHLRRNKRLWMPCLSWRRWLKPSLSNKAQFGNQVNPRISSIAESTYSTDDDSHAHLEEVVVEHANICLMNMNDKPGPRDPDVDAPVTYRERFFNHIIHFIDWLYSLSTVFALKAAGGFILLSLPAYLPQSVGWFTSWGGQWVANTLLMWMIPIAGMFNFTIILGLLGTICGGVLSIIVWEMTRANPYAMVVLTFIIMAPLHYVFFTNKTYSFLAIMTQYAYLMIITFAYNDHEPNTIEINAGKRMIFVCLGIIGSFLVNLIPRPTTGRVALRKRISRTFYDMSMVYGILFADIMRGSAGPSYPTPRQVKAFRRLSLHIQRQLKDEETYLALSKMEPPLNGRFPYKTYKELLERLNNMADILEGMGFTARHMDKTWRTRLMQIIDQDILDYTSCVLVIMRQMSASLISKMPLPPYVISPNNLKEKLSGNLCSIVSTYPEQINNDTFPSYSSYAVSCYLFIEELNSASACVENLLGIESPQKWLISNA